MVDVVLVTESACLADDSELKYAHIAKEEDISLMAAFRSYGLHCIRVAWEDNNFDWSTTRVAIIRSTWNYFEHIKAFRSWVLKASKQCHLINSKELILWNLDKNYLIDLNNAGIGIPISFILKKNAVFDPEYWFRTLERAEFVIKPTISGGSKDTFLIRHSFDSGIKRHVQSILDKQEMMVQPFVSSIKNFGELSLIYISGVFTHAVLKKT